MCMYLRFSISIPGLLKHTDGYIYVRPTKEEVQLRLVINQSIRPGITMIQCCPKAGNWPDTRVNNAESISGEADLIRSTPWPSKLTQAYFESFFYQPRLINFWLSHLLLRPASNS